MVVSKGPYLVFSLRGLKNCIQLQKLHLVYARYINELKMFTSLSTWSSWKQLCKGLSLQCTPWLYCFFIVQSKLLMFSYKIGV